MSPESLEVPGIAPADGGRVPGEAIPPLVFPPAMEARFRPALAALYEELHASGEVVALLCFGSAQRGEARPGSDLDLYALTRGEKQWLQSRVVEGVEVQLKVAPLRSWRGLIEKRNPPIIGAFATGVLLFDRTGEAAELKRLAEESLRTGPRELEASDVEGARYSLTNKVRDLEDMPGDSVPARMLASMTVLEAIRMFCMFHSMWVSRKPAVMLENLRRRDPSLAGGIEGYYGSPSTASAIAVADAVLEAMGGRLYEISTPPAAA
jgi:predicted nucleotidyltransferase